VVRVRAQARDARVRPGSDERVGTIGVHVVAGHGHVVGRRHPIEIDGGLTDVARCQASRHARRLRIATAAAADNLDVIDVVVAGPSVAETQAQIARQRQRVRRLDQSPDIARVRDQRTHVDRRPSHAVGA
ncbi:hypothetical protein MLD52_23350, partial [Puniceicoccaceae bacterium K14]|nr:hypothetical protein [Puniceicoccaceae bacterium K14]